MMLKKFKDMMINNKVSPNMGVVLSVPPFFSNRARKLVLAAAKVAKLDVL
jgi:hypothetical protein